MPVSISVSSLRYTRANSKLKLKCARSVPARKVPKLVVSVPADANYVAAPGYQISKRSIQLLPVIRIFLSIRPNYLASAAA
ncbi:hypothetical protein D3C87_1907790 [compost metagenome]